MTSRMFASKKESTRAAFLAVSLVICAALFCGCAAQPVSSSGGSASQSAQASAVDLPSWKTVGDALAARTEPMSSSWDDKHYVSVFEADGSYYRIVADVDEEAYKNANAVDCCSLDSEGQIEAALSGLALTSLEDITSDKIGQDELDGFVGKTGKDLAAEGFKFANYYMYDGDETGVQFDKDFFSYAFVFDVSVPEENIEDGGASIQDAVVKSVEFLSAAEDAADVSKL